MADATIDDAVERQLRAAGVELLAATFVDNGGISRCKLVPAGRVAHAVRAGIGGSTTFSVFTGLDLMGSARSYEVPTGDFRLVPDLDALATDGSPIAWAPADLQDQDGEPWPTCGRAFARRATAALAARGLEVSAAFETEWFAFLGDGAPAHAGPAYGLDAARQGNEVLLGVARRLHALGVPVDQIHAEYAHGQFEVSIAATPPVEAADRAVLVRDAIRTVCRELGLRASLSPKPQLDALGSGAHVHVSLWRDGRNLFGAGAEPGPTAEGRAFLAGLLRELPALVAVGCAAPVSYLRLGPSRWTGAFAIWGVENREAPLRLIRGSRVLRPASANVELKTVDASGNPYLVIGCLLTAGLAGIDDGLQLPPEVTNDPATLTAEDRAAAGIAALPASLSEATAALRASALLRAALGEPLHDALCAVREREAVTELDGEALLAAYRWAF
jgi:glutamine synthetase